MVTLNKYMKEDIDKKKSKKLGNELSVELMNSASKIIDTFLKNKVYNVNLKSDVDDPIIDKDIVFAIASLSMIDFFKGMHNASQKELRKKTSSGSKMF